MVTQFTQYNLGYSLNNIPLPSNDCYLKKLIQQTESFIKRIRWRVFWHENKHLLSDNVEQENYGFKTSNTPPQNPALQKFESDMYDLIGNIKFRTSDNKFQKQMKEDLSTLKSGGNIVVEADKTTNLYKVSPEIYKNLLQQNITKDYETAVTGKKEDIDRRTNILAQKLKIEDRMEQHTSTPAFLTLKDHKTNFTTNTQCRLINPAKSNLGIVSKKVLEKVISEIRTSSKYNLWRSSADVLKWFKNCHTTKKPKFMKFDIQEFYPTISSSLLDRAIKFARSYTNITKDEEEIIKLSKEALLFSNNKCWQKKKNPEFDVTMGSFDGAETSELVGLYLLSKISKIIDSKCMGLYRDDGLALIEDANRQSLDRLRKQLHIIFKDEDLKITVDLYDNHADFLDIYLKADDKSYKPYKKPNDNPLYINTESNHPKSIIKNIPDMVSKRLSNLSSDEKSFDEMKHDYESALRNSGFTDNIEFQTSKPNTNKRARKRKIIWYNPPYSSNVDTNIGRKFFIILDKHFPKKHHLNKVINRSTVKLSYCCMPNVGQILKGHNKKVLKQHHGDDLKEQDKPCNCRDKTNCPLQGKCQTKSVIYQADVKTEKGTKFTYIGLTEHEFKKRWYNHCQSFKHQKYETSTELSKLIWKLKNDNTKYTITWKILTKCQSYKPGSKSCNLCNTEKLYIIKNPDSINSRTELTSKCRHSRKYLIQFCD